MKSSSRTHRIDPALLSMSYETAIAEELLLFRRLSWRPDCRRVASVFVNLWRAPYLETDALALVRAVNAASSRPVLRSDGQPTGGSALMLLLRAVGRDSRWPGLGQSHGRPSLWRQARTGHFAAALERGELWTEDGAQQFGRIPIAAMAAVGNVGPQLPQTSAAP